MLVEEFMCGSCTSFNMYAALTQGAADVILTFGTPEQQATYVPKMIDGTAASRSTIAPNGRDSRAGAYWVRNTAIPTATGTANTSAKVELSAVTMNKSRIPNAKLCGLVVLNSALVKKFAWFARNDGTARINRNVAISRIAITIVEPAVAATNLNSRSPCHFAPAGVAVSAGVVPVRSNGVAGVTRVMPSQITRWR